jgi:hypothetical protein
VIDASSDGLPGLDPGGPPLPVFVDTRRTTKRLQHRRTMMIRPALLFALAVQGALVLSVTPSAAQHAGGESLSAEVLNTPGAAEMIRERAFARIQSLQAIRSIGAGLAVGSGIAPGGGPANPNSANPALDRSAVNQQALARIPVRPERSRSSEGDTIAPTFVDQSNTLVVNAIGSPVSIGSGNTVQQQVANSNAVSVGGPAIATAGAENAGGRGKSGGAALSQTATSTATSLGAGTSAPPAAKPAGGGSPR